MALSQGRETELEEVRLIYFDKEKTLLKKYKALQVTFEEFRKDMNREFDIQESISKKLQYEKDQLMKEIEIAKMILSNKELSQVANQRFKECIDNLNKEKIL